MYDLDKVASKLLLLSYSILLPHVWVLIKLYGLGMNGSIGSVVIFHRNCFAVVNLLPLLDTTLLSDYISD